MIIENGMVVGAEAEWDRRHELADKIREAILETAYYLRQQKVSRADLHKEVMDAIDSAPTQLIDHLKHCLAEDDMPDFISTIGDILAYDVDERARTMVNKEL